MFDTSFSACGCPICAAGLTGPFQLDQAAATGPGVAAAAAASAGSYQDYVDGLLSGDAWTTGTITYSFPDSGAHYGYDQEPEVFFPLSADFRPAADFALSAERGGSAQAGFSVAGFTELEVVHTTDHGDSTNIRIGRSEYDPDGSLAWAYYPGSFAGAGDVWFLEEPERLDAGSWAWSAMIHEIGHGLGLKHPHDRPPYMPLDMDGIEYTVMSYSSISGAASGLVAEPWGFAQSWMMLDIAALQAMYGADFTPNEDEVVYSWSPESGNTLVNGEIAIEPGANRIFATIWDGGGNVTYDLSAYDTGVQIDMRPGKSSTFDQAQLPFFGSGNYASGNIYNALLYEDDPRSLIRKVIGGEGDDHIVSNDGDNVIIPGDGDDTVIVHGGSNQVWAGPDDTGDDLIIIEGHGNNTAGGGPGEDVLRVNGHGDNTLYGGPGADRIEIDGHGDNTAWAGTEDDVIEVTGHGDNTVGGGEGDDTITISGGGNNTVYGGPGSDEITITGDGDNIVYGGGLNPDGSMTSNRITVDGGGANEIFNGAGNDVVILKAGATGDNLLWGGAGDDVFEFVSPAASATLKFVPGTSHDRVEGFDLAADHLVDLSDIFSSVAEVQAAIFVDPGGGSRLALGPDQSLVLDVAASTLSAAAPEDWLIL